MKINHLNCGSLNAFFPRAQAIVYCLLIETNTGLILVDTGFGRQDYSNPSLLMRTFTRWMGVPCKLEETAFHQISELGYTPEEVSHIVLTHLHLDHAGGLRDFQQAQVYLFRPEFEAAMNPSSLIERAYDPSHWSHRPTWVLYDDLDSDWYGFRAKQILEGTLPKIFLVPLPGHTRGHCGVAIATANGWLFQCGDAASPLHHETDIHCLEGNEHPADILPSWFVHRFIGPHISRLRDLVKNHGDETEVISAHDLLSFSKHKDASKDMAKQ